MMKESNLVKKMSHQISSSAQPPRPRNVHFARRVTLFSENKVTIRHFVLYLNAVPAGHRTCHVHSTPIRRIGVLDKRNVHGDVFNVE